MSTWIYGYIDPSTAEGAESLRTQLRDYRELGIREDPWENLYNWPTEWLPQQPSAICFSIHDRPGITGVQHVLNYLDYAPDAFSPLPLDKDRRLEMFLRLVSHLFVNTNVRRVFLAVTDCAQISRTHILRFDEFPAILRRDLHGGTLPDVLYIVGRVLLAKNSMSR
jgi:hypothetical protein